MTSEFVDKSAVGTSERQYHIAVAPGEVGAIALLPGDPFRVPLIAEFLDNPREVAHNREHLTMVGTYRGTLVTATSTGMGCPSTAIAVEELGRCGVTMFIRVGSTAGLQPGIEPGDLIVSEGSLRTDGTSDAYVPRGYPAVPDLELTLELERIAKRRAAEAGVGFYHGINATSDAFYAETPAVVSEFTRLGLKNIEMESSALYVVARQRGWRAGMICACSSNLATGDSLYDHTKDRLKAGWRLSIEVALEAAVNLQP